MNKLFSYALQVVSGGFIAFVILLVSTTSAQAQTETYFFHTDHLGTPQAVTDVSQEVVWQAEYQPFGEVVETVALVEQNLRFPGQYFDEESGLHYNYFRDYDPTTGRYVESDPIGLEGGLNTYGYVYANPVAIIDREGRTGTILVPRPIIVPKPTPLPSSPIDPVLPIPDIPIDNSIPGNPNPDPFSEFCRRLAKKINNLRKDIFEKRIPALEINPRKLPERIGPGEDLSATVRGHRKLLNRRFRELKKREDEYAKNCSPMACLTL